MWVIQHIILDLSFTVPHYYLMVTHKWLMIWPCLPFQPSQSTLNSTATAVADPDNDWPRGPRSEGLALCVVHIIQSISITLGNAITIAVFTKNKRFSTKKYHFLRNLAIPDFLVGAVVVPCWTYDLATYFDLWAIMTEPTESTVATAESIDLTIKYASLIGLMAVALERTYATLCPLKHRLVWAESPRKVKTVLAINRGHVAAHVRSPHGLSISLQIWPFLQQRDRRSQLSCLLWRQRSQSPESPGHSLKKVIRAGSRWEHFGQLLLYFTLKKKKKKKPDVFVVKKNPVKTIANDDDARIVWAGITMPWCLEHWPEQSNERTSNAKLDRSWSVSSYSHHITSWQNPVCAVLFDCMKVCVRVRQNMKRPPAPNFH